MSPLDPELALPEAEMTLRFRRWLSVLVGFAALCAAGLSYIEVDGGRKEEQAFVDGSRGALDIFVKLAASSPRAQFEGNALRRAVVVQAEGTARVISTPAGAETFGAALREAEADQRAGKRLARVASQMSEVPAGDVPGLDAATLAAIKISDLTDLQGLVEEQNATVEAADRYGTRQERAFFSLGLVASAAALLGLAGLMGATRAGRISLTTAAVALFAAVAWTASAFV